MKNKKGAFRVDWLLIGVAIFSLIFMTGVVIVQDIDSGYGDIINLSDDDFEIIQNQMPKTYTVAEKAKNLTMDSDITDQDTLESMTRGSYSGVRTSAKDSFKLIGNVTNVVAQKLGLPGYFISFFVLISTVSLTFYLIHLLRGIVVR